MPTDTAAPRRPRVVFAPDSFKGTVSAGDAARALARGWATERDGDDLVVAPMADGGEGTLDAFAEAVPGAQRRSVRVLGPDDRQVEAAWLALPGGTALVELASTSGIGLLDPLRPFEAHTYGFGEAIRAALDAGSRRLLLALGGSASTDGGTGALAALGARFLDADGSDLPRGNAGLRSLDRVDWSGVRPVPPEGVSVLSDVSSPLLGPDGAARVFGPQKGAAGQDVPLLEEGLARLHAVLGGDAAAPGAGAAGGAGFGLQAWGARHAGGAAAVARAIGLPELLAEATAVITGEGRYDSQSAFGKVAWEVADLADTAGVPALLVAGEIASDPGRFPAAASLTEIMGSAEAAMAEPVTGLERAGAVLARLFRGRS